MGTWSISPENSGGTINASTGVASFEENSTQYNKIYTITYTDDNGCVASTTYTVASGETCQCPTYEIRIDNQSYYVPAGNSNDFILGTFFIYKNGEKYTEDIEDFLSLTINGEGSPAITDLDFDRPNVNAPYRVLLDVDSCDYVGKYIDIIIKLNIGNCPEVSEPFESVIVGESDPKKYSVGFVCNDSTVTSIIVHFRAKYNNTICGEVTYGMESSSTGPRPEDGSIWEGTDVFIFDNSVGIDITGLAINSMPTPPDKVTWNGLMNPILFTYNP